MTPSCQEKTIVKNPLAFTDICEKLPRRANPAGHLCAITNSDSSQKLQLPLSTYDQLGTRTTNFWRAIEMCESQKAQKGAANPKLRSILGWL
jgi:hypothetical protein